MPKRAERTPRDDGEDKISFAGEKEVTHNPVADETNDLRRKSAERYGPRAAERYLGEDHLKSERPPSRARLIAAVVFGRPPKSIPPGETSPSS